MVVNPATGSHCTLQQGLFFGREQLDYQKIHQWLGSEEGIMATPHSQRSAAELRVRLTPTFEMFPIVELIDAIENSLKTPVQATVKREDEQAFAELNAANLKFVEDAVRLLYEGLDTDPRISDFRVFASHKESLHSHDAISVIIKGVPGGFDANIEPFTYRSMPT